MRKATTETRETESSGQSTGLIVVLLIAAIVIGGLLGYFLPMLAPLFQVVGNIYLSLLAALTVGLILSSIVTGLSVIGDQRKLWRLVGKSGLYFLLIGLVAIGIGAIVSLAIAPEANLSATSPTAQPELLQSYPDSSFQDRFYLSRFTSSLFQGQYIYIILFAILLGAALIRITTKSALVLNFFSESNAVLIKLTRFMLRLAPVGLIAIIGSNVERWGLSFLGGESSSLLLAVVLATVLFGVVFLPLTLVFVGREPLGSFFGGLGPALLTAFAASSASKNLAFTYEAVTTRAGIDERSGATVPPLGTILNFGATAMFAIIAAGYIVRSGSIELSILQWFGIALGVALLSIGTAGVPLIGTAALAAMFGAIGLGHLADGSVFATVLLAEVILIDRLRATLNVWGDAVGAAVIGQTFDLKTVRVSTKTVSKRATAARSVRGDRERRSGRPDTRPGQRVERRDRNGRRSQTSTPITARGRRTTRADSRPTKPKAPIQHKSRSSDIKTPPSPFTINADLPASGLEVEAGTLPTLPPADDSPPTAPVRKRSSSRTAERRPTPRTPKEDGQRQATQPAAQPDAIAKDDSGVESTRPEPRRPAVRIERRVPRMESSESPPIDEKPSVTDPVESKPEDIAEGPESTTPSKPEPEIAAIEPAAAAAKTTPEPDAAPVVYGRSRVRKGAALKTGLDKKTDETPAEKKEPPPELTSETTDAPTKEMTFGRGKRKRIR